MESFCLRYMQKKYIIKKIVIVIAAVFIAVIGCVFMFNKQGPKNDTKGDTANILYEAGDNEAFLIDKYALPYRQLYIDGDNLIDGIYGNRTFYAILLKMPSASNPRYYIGDKRVSFNNKLFKTKDGYLLFSICDNIKLQNLRLVVNAGGQDAVFEVDKLKKKAAEDLINVQKIADNKYAFAMPTDKTSGDNIRYVYDIVCFGNAWDISKPVDINIDPADIGNSYQYKITALSDTKTHSNSKQISIEYIMNLSKESDELKKVIRQQLMSNKIIVH